MERKHNKLLTPNAKELRKNMTSQEKHLWYDFLASYEIRILRQKVIDNFILDFYCAKAKLAIEIDGGQHFTDDGIIYDEQRTNILNKYGIMVIRFSNKDIDNNFTGVCEYIDYTIKNIEKK